MKRGRKPIPLDQRNGRDSQAARWMRENGGTMREAAARFGITHQAVEQAWSRLGFGETPKQVEWKRRDSVIAKMANDGKTAQEIASQLGLDTKTIYATTKRLGVPLASPLDEGRFRIAEGVLAIENGATVAEAARIAGCTYGHMQRALIETDVRPHASVAVCGRRLGLSEKASAMIDAEGIAITTAAARVGVSATSLRSWRLRRGLPIRLVRSP